MHSQFAACLVDSPRLHQFQAQSAFSKAFMQRNPGFAWDVELELELFATLASKSLSCFPQPELQISLSLLLQPICKRQVQPSSLLSADRSRESLIRNRWQRCAFFFLCLPLIRVELVPLIVCLVCCCAKSLWVSEDIYLLLPMIINLPTTNNNNPLWVVRILLLLLRRLLLLFLLLQVIHQHPIHNNHNDK